MTMRARVQLIGSLSDESRGRSFKKGSPQILTNAADIKYYQAQGGYSVTILSQAKPPVKESTLNENDDDEGNESDNDYTESDLRKMKKAELIEVAEELGLETEGTVNELIGRILESA